MNSFARVVVTLGSGLAAYGMAFIVCRDKRYEKAATPLFLIAGLLQPTGILVAFDEFGSGGDWRVAALITAGVMLVQQWLTFWVTRRSELLFLTLVFAVSFCATGMDLVGLEEDLIWMTLGATMLLVSYSIARTAFGGVTPFWYFTGSAAFLTGLFSIVEGSVVEVVFLGAACGLVFLSTWVKSRSVLVVSTIAILSYIGYYTAEHFADTVGWPIALMLFGFMLIGLSAAALRINRKYIATA